MNDRARRRAITAVCLDCAWVAALVIAAPTHMLAAEVTIPVLALGVLAVKVRSVGYVLSPVRAFGALIMLIVAAASSTALLLLSVAAAVSAVDGVAAALPPRRALLVRHTGNPRTRRPRSKRFDEVGSAIVHFAFVGLLIGALLAQRRVAAAAGFLLWWIAVTWGTIAVHEAGHAFAALRTDNDVLNVRIGDGLTLFRVGRVTIGAFPFLGRTRWAPNESTMTSRREVYIVLGGPAANFLAAFALFSFPIVRSDGLGLTLVGAQVGLALLNLVPFEQTRHGQRTLSDGARALRLLRS